MINQFFCRINQKIIRHTENFWGSGSYSKAVRPNGFLFTDGSQLNRNDLTIVFESLRNIMIAKQGAASSISAFSKRQGMIIK